MQRLVKDAYIEMKAGHSVEAPSQRLIDICQNVEDIAKVQGPSTQIPHSQETFAACHSEQMQSNMFANSVKKGLGYVGVGVAGLAAATVSAASFMGAAALGGFGGETPKPQDRTGLSSRLAARRAENEPDPDPEFSNNGIKIG